MAAVSHSIQKVSTDLYSSQSTTSAGHSIHFGFEKIDSDNLDFWQCYVEKTEGFAEYFHYLSKITTQTDLPAFNEAHSAKFGGDEEEFKAVSQLIQTRKYFQKPVFEGIGGGTFGMSSILERLKGRTVYIAFASDRPILKKHTLESPTNPTTWAEYRAAFGDVVMSLACITAENPGDQDQQVIFPLRRKAIEETMTKFNGTKELEDKLYKIAYMITDGDSIHYDESKWTEIFEQLQIPHEAGHFLRSKLEPSMALPPPATVQTVTHFGIFKNPLYFLEKVETFAGISPDLHGFSAAAALELFPGAKYMITNPLDNMAQILSTHLGPALHLGSNSDLQQLEKKSEKQRKGLSDHPPILHIDSHTGVQKIAKEGVDLSQHLDTLPDESAEIIVPAYTQLDFSPCITTGGLKAVISLESLAKLFDKT